MDNVGTVAQELKELAFAEIDRQAEKLTALSEDILRHPELGYRETRTASVVAGEFRAMGLEPQEKLARTGVKARLRGRSAGATAAVLGELDALLLPGHAYADPDTGAAHACGHNAQIASMVGVGLGLQTVIGELDGDVVLFAVPAEECVQAQWRLGLRDAGEITHTSGKAELIATGHFDDVDLALLTHAVDGDTPLTIGGSASGALLKRVRFRGRSAHAAAAPWAGVSALKAATVAIAAIDAHREFFKDEDGVRVHYLITDSGDSISAVPASTGLEMMVRAGSVEAMREASGRIDQALRGGALAMGADVEITTAVFALPLHNDEGLARYAVDNGRALVGEDGLGLLQGSIGASTDMGDLSRVMPVLQPLAAAGVHVPPHSSTFYTADHHAAAVVPAKLMAAIVIDLLVDGAAGARKTIAESEPKIGRQEFVALHESLSGTSTFSGAAPGK